MGLLNHQCTVDLVNGDSNRFARSLAPRQLTQLNLYLNHEGLIRV